jgi:hypothetical protein
MEGQKKGTNSQLGCCRNEYLLHFHAFSLFLRWIYIHKKDGFVDLDTDTESLTCFQFNMLRIK